jgi:hypothetical protein
MTSFITDVSILAVYMAIYLAIVYAIIVVIIQMMQD